MQRGRAAATAAGLLTLALTIGGCATSDLLGSSSSGTSASASAGGSAGSGVFGSSNTADSTQASLNTEVDCPGVDVRSGAATLMIGSKPGGGEPAALDLRYQGSIVRAARECTVRGGTMTMKVGIEGRIITGPAGGPGQIEVPLRFAVVQEGPEPKTVLSKLYRIPVTIEPDQGRTNFTQVDSDISFPMPQPAGLISSYVVYVGFDPAAATPQKPKKPAAAKPRPRR